MTCLPRSHTRIPLGLFILLWMLDVAVFMSEKSAVGGSAFDAPAAFYVRLLHQPWWWVGLAMGPLQLWVWMAILRRAALSVAYAFSSASYLLTMAAAWLAFHERLGWSVWLGALCITVGIALVGSAASSRIESAAGLATDASGASNTVIPRTDRHDNLQRVGKS